MKVEIANRIADVLESVRHKLPEGCRIIVNTPRHNDADSMLIEIVVRMQPVKSEDGP